MLKKLIFFLLQVRVLCGVNHDDLEQLFNVSTTIREAVSNQLQENFQC
jgi:hypothetical protein